MRRSKLNNKCPPNTTDIDNCTSSPLSPIKQPSSASPSTRSHAVFTGDDPSSSSWDYTTGTMSAFILGLKRCFEPNKRNVWIAILSMILLIVSGLAVAMEAHNISPEAITVASSYGGVASSYGGMHYGSGPSGMSRGASMEKGRSHMVEAEEYDMMEDSVSDVMEEEMLSSARKSQSMAGKTLGDTLLQSLNQGEKAADEDVPNSDDVVPKDRMLVHRGNLNLLSPLNEMDTLADKVESLAKEDGKGYVQSRSKDKFHSYEPFLPGYRRVKDVKKRHNHPNWKWKIDLELRVSDSKFHAIVDSIKKLVGDDRIVKLSTHSDDVTEQYFDASARADTLDASRKALETLLSRADSVKDVLNVQRELNQLTQNAESQRKRAISLKKSAKFSFLSVHIEELVEEDDDDNYDDIAFVTWEPYKTLKKAINRMIIAFHFLGDMLIYAMVIVAGISAPFLFLQLFWKLFLRPKSSTIHDHA